MPYQSLPLVRAMQSYLPFDADSGGLYEEHVRLKDAPPSYETDALKHVLEKLRDSGTQLIVLTGDAGHGKTHLCRRIVEIGMGDEAGGRISDAQSALARLTSDREGRNPIHLSGVGRDIRVVKDLSDFDEAKGAEILADVLEDPTKVGVVCANEGRLRSVVSNEPIRLRMVKDALESGIREGRTTVDGVVHVINLNYQASGTSAGFLSHLLKNWVGDQRRWRGCENCSAASECPIRKNGRFLALDESAREGFMQFVRSAEQSGYVLTYREALILVSFVVTGDRQCEDIARLHSAGSMGRDRLGDLALEALLFEADLTEPQRDQLPILGRLRRFDPGTEAFRTVDESVLTALEQDTASGPLVSFSAQTNGQRKQEAKRHLNGSYLFKDL